MPFAWGLTPQPPVHFTQLRISAYPCYPAFLRMLRLMHPSRLVAPVLALTLLASSCSIFHRKRASPPTPTVTVEAVRTPDSPTPPTAARDLADVMTSVLRLRPDQTTKVRHILNLTVEQVNVARQQYPAQSPPLNAALTRINTSSEKQLREVLGPVTYKELQTKRPQIQNQMQQLQLQRP